MVKRVFMLRCSWKMLRLGKGHPQVKRAIQEAGSCDGTARSTLTSLQRQHVDNYEKLHVAKFGDRPADSIFHLGDNPLFRQVCLVVVCIFVDTWRAAKSNHAMFYY